MTNIDFYRQQRFDGGVRSGIGVNNVTILERFNPGRRESNPALLWYIDVRLEGKSLPQDPDAVREWLRRENGFIRRGLSKAADQLELGIDADVLPFMQELRDAQTGVK